MIDKFKHLSLENRHQPDAETVSIDNTASVYSPYLKQLKAAKTEKIACKAKMSLALREARLRQRIAASAEKHARAKEARAEKLAKKADAARSAATYARETANILGEHAVFAEQSVETKLAELKDAVSRLRRVERDVKISQKQKIMKKHEINQVKKKKSKAGLKRMKNINAFGG